MNQNTYLKGYIESQNYAWSKKSLLFRLKKFVSEGQSRHYLFRQHIVGIQLYVSSFQFSVGGNSEQ